MKLESFLITTTIGDRSRRFVWDGQEAIPLDHPARWILERTPSGIWLRDVTTLEEEPKPGPLQFRFPDQIPGKGVNLALASYQGTSGTETRKLAVNVRRLEPIWAPYQIQSALQHRPEPGSGWEIFLYSGIRYFLTRSKPVGSSYIGTSGGRQIFRFMKNSEGYQFVAFVPGVRLRRPGEKKREVSLGMPELVNESQLIQSTITWGVHWWRFARVAVPPAIPDIGPPERTEDQIWFKWICGLVAACFIAALAWVIAIPHNLSKTRVERTIAVNLKAPKLIPPQPKPTPTPTPTPVAVVKPKPEPPRRKPRHKRRERRKRRQVVVKREPRRPKPRPKIVRRPIRRPEPTRIVRRPPPPVPTPPRINPAVERAKAEALAKARAQAQAVAAARAQARAQAEALARAKAAAKAQLSRSLGFLSSSSNRPAARIAVDPKSQDNYAAGDAMGAASAKRFRTSVLNKMTANGGSDGPIDTRSARSIASASVRGIGREGRGKGLNDVQGRVSLAALYDPSRATDLSAAIAAKSFSISGPGQIDQSAVERALQKHLAKFEYCYEKALLTNPSLAGTVMMQWTIAMGGGAQTIHVVRSQLNDASLHRCITHELARIHFPSPRGGPVEVKYPFAFSASGM